MLAPLPRRRPWLRAIGRALFRLARWIERWTFYRWTITASHGFAYYGRRIYTGEAPAWRAVVLADPCAYCYRPSESIEHVTPRSQGGGGAAENLVGACVQCNQAKADQSAIVFLIKRGTVWKRTREQERRRLATQSKTEAARAMTAYRGKSRLTASLRERGHAG